MNRTETIAQQFDRAAQAFTLAASLLREGRLAEAEREACRGIEIVGEVAVEELVEA